MLQFSHRVTPYDFGYGVSVPATGDAKEHKEYVSPSGHTEGEYRVLQPNGLYRYTRVNTHSFPRDKSIVSLAQWFILFACIPAFEILISLWIGLVSCDPYV